MDEDKVYNPPSLEHLAFKVSFKEILSNLVLCPDHRPKEKKLKWLPFSSLLSTIPYFKSEQLISIVRSHLDKYLVGTMGDKIRRKYVNKFHDFVTEYGEKPDSYRSQLMSKEEKEELEEDKRSKEEYLVDLWAFLDCVLDNSFEDLDTNVALPGCEPNAKLIKTIAKRSPLLKKLELDFYLMKEGTKSEILRPVILSLKSLEHLTNLLFMFPDELEMNLRASLLSLVGEACPLLTKLTVIGGGVFSKKEIFGLLMGEWAYNKLSRGTEEPEWLEDTNFSRSTVSKKYLSPIGRTLRELSLEENDICAPSTSKIYGSSAIFILRHLSLLENLNLPLSTAVAIKGFYKQQFSFQLELEKECQQAFPCEAGEPSQLNPAASSFPGSLSLTSIYNVDAFDKEMLRAIGYLCPLLQEATFQATYKPKDGQTAEDLMSPDELEIILNDWPKLTKITLNGFRPEHVTSFLKVFSAELIQLKLSGCKFAVRQLFSCPKLELLRIYPDCTLLDDPTSGMDPPINSSTLLPLLKEFTCCVCLGSSSHVFENKSTLVSLDLHCCHFGCKESKDRPFTINAASQSDWNRAPQMWPLLQDLSIRSCVGLTWTMLANLAPQFPKLKSITLPIEMKKPRLLNQLSIQNPCIAFRFRSSIIREECPYI